MRYDFLVRENIPIDKIKREIEKISEKIKVVKPRDQIYFVRATTNHAHTAQMLALEMVRWGIMFDFKVSG